MASDFVSFGRYPQVDQFVDVPRSLDAVRSGFQPNTLPVGNGRSYADVCLNDNGSVLNMCLFKRFLDFDPATGLLTAEAGVQLSDILTEFVPRGWFVPVTPGTRFVTLAGAIANDVHGKNHHVAGTFGCHVTRMSLLRSDGQILEISPTENAELFSATIGGMGLTGIILNATLRLIPIKSAMIDEEVEKFGNLDEFFAVSAKSDSKWDYTVGWIDCLQSGARQGRGHFIRGNHAETGELKPGKEPKIQFPMEAPDWALNKWTVKAFNALYYNRLFKKVTVKPVHYEPFFYPLDIVLKWNKLYGRRGFCQFQCVVPHAVGKDVMRQVLTLTAKSGLGSFLAVLKEFGDVKSPGMLSFPEPGITVCLDFPMVEGKTEPLMKDFERLVLDAQGKMYPAKDGFMSAESFQRMYPRWEEFTKYVDPAITSSYARRVMPQFFSA